MVTVMIRMMINALCFMWFSSSLSLPSLSWSWLLQSSENSHKTKQLDGEEEDELCQYETYRNILYVGRRTVVARP